MAKTHLTDEAVKRYKRPHKARTEISDTEPGLFLHITPNGTKSWIVIYRLPADDGRRTSRGKHTLGRFPTVGVAAAREAARAIMAQAAQGIDPKVAAIEAKAAEERERHERLAGSFRAVAEEFVAAMKAGKLTGGRNRPVAMTTALNRESLLTRLVLPTLGDKDLTEISPKMVSQLLSSLEKVHGPVDETLKVIRGVFKFAVSRGLLHGMLPTEGMTNRQAPTKETRALTDEELRAIWRAAGQQGVVFGSIVRMLMLTGQRKAEIAGLRWEEVDWDRKLLVVPANRVKNRAGAHEVPLSDVAIQILRDVETAYKQRGLKSGLVFPSDTGETPVSGWMKLKKNLERTACGELAGLTTEDFRAIRAGGALTEATRARKAAALAKIEAASEDQPSAPWRIHDLRQAFITRCRDGEENAEGEITWSAPLDVLQAAVNHEITAGVTGRYDHGDIQRRYRLRKRELMEWWSRKLLTIVEGTQAEKNVVQFLNGHLGSTARSGRNSA